MRWQKYLAAVFVVLGSVVGGYVVSLYSPWGATPQEGHPPIVDCSYDAETETATLVVQEERYVDEEFEEVWVLVDGQPATIRRGDRRGEVNETDPDTTTTGLWVHDGNITDVADYPVGPGESVTVFDVAPDSHVRIVLVAERTGGADLGFDAEPISENCVLDAPTETVVRRSVPPTTDGGHRSDVIPPDTAKVTDTHDARPYERAIDHPS